MESHRLDLSAVRAVIFDFNGVLIDDEPLHEEAYRRLLRGLGIELTTAVYDRWCLGLPDSRCLPGLLAAYELPHDPAAIPELLRRKDALYEALVADHLPLVPEALELVRALHGRLPVAVCSGARREEIDRALAAAGITACFEIIVSTVDLPFHKPEPGPYLHTLDALRAATGRPELVAADCLVIEDSPAGVTAARAAGMRCVAVHRRGPADALSAAHQVVTSLGELLPAALLQSAPRC